MQGILDEGLEKDSNNRMKKKRNERKVDAEDAEEESSTWCYCFGDMSSCTL